MKKEIITINGGLGSGKSSTADLVAKELGFKRFSSGDFFRQVGLELGLSINEINIRAETDKKIDEMTDQKLRDLNNKNKIVIDSRTAYHWIPESFKVYLNLPPEIAKDRILSSLKVEKLRQQSENMSSAEEVYKKITERFESEQKRYWDLYKINNTDKKNYDLIIDTNKNNLEQVVKIIVLEYKKWIAEN
ncbi:MAG: cytidylate kinase family protein [Candidatus Nomurabacteria bacterium]|nr:cytidylate kinase family protein [Candidatus Nomurabacteria bacterium]